MGCGSCSSGGCTVTIGSKPSGCNSGGCSSGGCNKMNVFDWLGNMHVPVMMRFPIVEVKFKGGRKEYFLNEDEENVYFTGDPVIVDAQKGFHIGYVSLQGELVRLQLRKYKLAEKDITTKILRKADEKDLQKFVEVQNREITTLYRSREIIKELNLQMKLSDIEYQADNTKATFFYSAETRVDFRELIKRLASEFRIRVEMRQISLRQEAGRIGGIGSCGRELCCSTWLTDFKGVGTSTARYQNISLNPSKLTGQCGRLKCCLNYELDTYMQALEFIPKVEVLYTEKGTARIQKTDIFRKIMWFSYDGENSWHPLPTQRVSEVAQMNEKGDKPFSLVDNEERRDSEDAGSEEGYIEVDQDAESQFPTPEREERPKKNTRKKLPLKAIQKTSEEAKIVDEIAASLPKEEDADATDTPVKKNFKRRYRGPRRPNKGSQGNPPAK